MGRKSGDKNTGTAKEIINIIEQLVGTGLLFTEKIKCDGGTNLIANEIKDYAKIEDSFEDIQALNISSAYNNRTKSPYESMHGHQPGIPGIPRPEFVTRQSMSKKSPRVNHKEERNPEPYGCRSGNMDKDKQTIKEQLLDDFWEENIHAEAKKLTQVLTPGDNVYFGDNSIRGFGRWRPGIIISKKGEREVYNKIQQQNGYSILDKVTGRNITRTRDDIRIKKKTKVEAKIYKEYIKFLNKMNELSYGPQNDNEKFDKDYNLPNLPQTTYIPTEQQQSNTPEPEEKEETQAETVTTQEPEPQDTTPLQPTQPQEKKPSREENNLKSNVGKYWECEDHADNEEPIARRLRTRVISLAKVLEESETTELKDEEINLRNHWDIVAETDRNIEKWKKIYEETKKKDLL